MNIFVTSIDKLENRKVLAEWEPLPSQYGSDILEWNTDEVEVCNGIKIALTGSFTTSNNNLSMNLVEDGDAIFSGYFNIIPTPVIMLKSKTGCWLEFNFSSL